MMDFHMRCKFQSFWRSLGLPVAWFLDVGEPYDLTFSKQPPPSCPRGIYTPEYLITVVASLVGQDPCRCEGGCWQDNPTSGQLLISKRPTPGSEDAGCSATSSSLHPATSPFLSFSLTQIYTEEGNGGMSVKRTKFHFCRMSNFWRSNAQHGDSS